jgi:FHS family L-fucose permease-like MFS transporter
MGIFAFAFIVLLVVRIPEPRRERQVSVEEAIVSDRKYSAMSFRHFVMGVVAIFIYVGVEVGIPNIMNLYMTTEGTGGGLGIAPVIAGSFVSVYWALMLAGRLMGGVLGAKISSKSMLSFTAGLGILFVLIAIFMPVGMSFTMFGATVPVKILFFVLCGFCTSIMWGSIFNLAVEGLGKYTEMASGIFMMMVVGGGILPWVQGLIADGSGFLNSYWLIVAGLAYLLYYALIGSKNVNQDIPVK